ARLHLPNGQVTRSLWKESCKALHKLRIARNVKVLFRGMTQFAEVRFYFSSRMQEKDIPLALISLFSPPDPGLMEASSNTVLSCMHQGDDGLAVVEVNCIIAGVAMVPYTNGPNSIGTWFFVAEKMGLDVTCMDGRQESIVNE
ncbi:hypothetical protein HETIRDRAFT_53847, partial [Heterobasidion irregulare TC 32-1]